MPARLAQHLVQRGLLPAERVDEALRRQAVSGGALDTILLEQGVIAEAGMLQALGDVSQLRPVNLADFEPNHEVAPLIPMRVAERLGIVPLSVDGNTLHVASVYPPPSKDIGEVSVLLGKQVELWVAVEARVRDWISAVYKQPLPTRFAALLAALDPNRPLPATALLPNAPKEIPPAPAPQTPPPLPKAAKPQLQIVDDASLEDSLTRDMVEQLARNVAEEPILLQNKKTRATEEPHRTNRPTSDFEETVVRPAYVPSQPATWDREETKPLSPEVYEQFVRESRLAKEQPAPEQRELPSAPAVAPVRSKTDTSFPAVQPPPPSETDFSDIDVEIDSGPPDESENVAPSVQLAAPSDLTPQAPELGAEVRIDHGVPEPTPSTPRPPSGVVIFPGSADPTTTDFPMPAVNRTLQPPEVSDVIQPAPEEVPQWSLAEAREVLRQGTSDREYIIDVALRYARQTFEFACAFAVLRGTAVGWDARGEYVDRALIQQISIPLDAQSVFRTVALTRGSFVGPMPSDQLTHYFLSLLGRQPRTGFLFAVEVKGRLVAILYGDCGSRPISQRRLSDFVLFCQELPNAFQELIVYRKRYLAQQWAEAQAAQTLAPDADPYAQGQQWSAPEEQQPAYEAPPAAEETSPEPPGLVAAAPMLSTATEESPRPAGLGWNAWGSARASGVGRSATMPVFVTREAERPPPDFTPTLRRLVGPDAADRSRAMAELARVPEAAAKVLAENFPGPTAWSRQQVMELPEADELGPIPGALARLGRSGAQALAPLLDSDDSDTRYLALLTAGNLPYAELVGGVLRGLFDYEPDISSAARAAALSLRRLPRFDAAMKDLRKEIAARDPLRRSLAARALGGLHDRESVDGLINLTGSDDQMCAQAAAEALREITRQNYGTTTRFWLAWWAENRDKRRVEWLVHALRSRDLDLRQAAIDELSRAVNDTLGFVADESETQREPAVRRWEALIMQSERGRKFEL